MEPSKPRRSPKPPWLRTKIGGGPAYSHIARTISAEGLHTVCESARCPNLGECWGCGTATFMILGSVCTRACRFCSVAKGIPQPPEAKEPAAVARAVSRFGLRYVVITSVTRDDLQDGGAQHFALTIDAVRAAASNCSIEVLIPDLLGQTTNFETIATANPEVLNHNVETIPRLYAAIRPGAAYERSLSLIRWFADRSFITKSAVLVGLGETRAELVQTFKDLAQAGCSILVIGQYLQPTAQQVQVTRYLEPKEFEELAELAQENGIAYVVAAPLARSSYHAAEAYAAVQAKRG